LPSQTTVELSPSNVSSPGFRQPASPALRRSAATCGGHHEIRASASAASSSSRPSKSIGPPSSQSNETPPTERLPRPDVIRSTSTPQITPVISSTVTRATSPELTHPRENSACPRRHPIVSQLHESASPRLLNSTSHPSSTT